MSATHPRLDAGYIEAKRRQLIKLRDELRGSTRVAQSEEGGLNDQSNLQSREYEDDAQKLDLQDREGALLGRDVDRLAQVQRALRKIEEGTYGLSDVSGQPIPQERLDVMPDALTTLSEQKAGERAGQ